MYRCAYAKRVILTLLSLTMLCYPCGALLLRTKANCCKRMRRLVSVKVGYILVKDTFRMGLPTNFECFSLW